MATLDHPYHFDGGGRTATTTDADHIRDLIEEVLLTSPGERVMRPDFGAGLLRMVFEPNGAAIAATTQFVVQSALQQHLGHLIAVSAVVVENIDSTLRVTVRYVVLGEGTGRESTFVVPGAVA